LGVALGGREAPAAVHEWRIIAELLRITDVEIQNGPVPGLHPTRSGRLVAPSGEHVGTLGEVDPQVLESYGVPERVAWIELDLDTVARLPRGEQVYRPVSVYPSSDIDLAFTVPDDVPANAVERTLRRTAGDLLASLRLFDVYRGPGIAEGHRSLAFALRLD